MHLLYISVLQLQNTAQGLQSKDCRKADKTPNAWRQVWLKQPLVDLEAINQRLDIVDAFVGDSSLREALRDIHLRGVSLQSCLPAACPGATDSQTQTSSQTKRNRMGLNCCWRTSGGLLAAGRPSARCLNVRQSQNSIVAFYFSIAYPRGLGLYLAWNWALNLGWEAGGQGNGIENSRC